MCSIRLEFSGVLASSAIPSVAVLSAIVCSKRFSFVATLRICVAGAIWPDFHISLKHRYS
jgi:hypothetical protein